MGQRRLPLVLAGAVALATALVAVPSNADAAVTTLTTSSRDVMVTMRDGVQVLATVVTPAGAPAGGGRWPVVIMPGTYAGDGVNANLMAGQLAGRGYVAVSYIERGLGRSTGEIDNAGPKDVADVSDVLTWTLANTDSDPARAGVASVSYGAGFIPMVVAADPRFKAGAMVSGWGDMWDSRFPGGTDAVASAIALQSIGSGQGRMSAEGTAFFDGAIAGQETAAMKRYAAARSPMSVLPQLRSQLQSRSVPLYMSTSMNEMIWPADQTVRFWQQYPGVKHLDIMPGDHATTELFMDEGNVGYTWNAAFDWMDAYVAGKAEPIRTQGPIRVVPRSWKEANVVDTKKFTDYRPEIHASVTDATSTLRYGFSSQWGLFGAATTLTPGTGSGTKSLREGTNILMSQGLPMYQGALEILTGSPGTVNLAFVDQGVTGVWTAPALTKAVSIRGAIPVHLELKPTAATGSVFVYALDRAPDGNTYVIGHKPYSWAGAKAGAPLPVDVSVPYQAYDVPAGHRLTIAVSTGDINYLDKNPAGSSVAVGPGSYVTFPLK